MVTVVVLGFAALVLGSMFLDLHYGDSSGTTADDSHLQDHNLHVDELVSYAWVPASKMAQG